ncbi:MAG: hypothetical protein M0R46_01075 [Candidatus Muirbacterium halophilum]|nr:hypothetical protein [Candidatus Muirbacterium halophilum]MCK9474487.1 hypothetical protein [Candidatus Muirbacterium halophilum]
MKIYLKYLLISIFIIGVIYLAYSVFHSESFNSFKQASFYKHITEYQRILRTKLSSLMISLRKDKSTFTFFSIILISFLYGIIHAAGPGHGKFILSSLILSEKSKVSKAFFASFTMGTLHSLSAITIVLSIYYILKLPVTAYFESSEKVLKNITASAIILISLFQFYNIFKKNNNNHSTFKGVVVSAGLVPCPATSIILLFSLNLKMLNTGLFSVAAMSVGMSTGIFLSALLTLFLKNSGNKMFEFEKNQNIVKIIRIIGTSFILLTGLFILI